MKHNINKNKLNFRNVYQYSFYHGYSNGWKYYYDWDRKYNFYFRKPRNHNKKKLYCKHNLSTSSIVDSWDDIRVSRNYTSWKDRTKRRHQYQFIKEDNYSLVNK